MVQVQGLDRIHSQELQVKEQKKGDKVKEVWTCKVCKKDFTQDSDKVVQCEYCEEYYCSKCLDLSTSAYEGFKNPSLHWFCPSCEDRVMKNLRTEKEIETRCAEFLLKMENRLVKLECDMKNESRSCRS